LHHAVRVFLTSVGLIAACASPVQIDPSDSLKDADPGALSRIAFGSCANQRKSQPIWNAVLSAEPNLFIFMGDNVYGDVSSAEVTELKDAYAELQTVTEFQTLRGRIPILSIWDDHDYGINDGGSDFPYKYATKDLFLEFWDIPPDDPRRQREGLYYATTFGPLGQRVQVILLDTRFFRSPLKPSDAPGSPGKEHYVPDYDPAKTMLGEEQWAWLEQELSEPADIRLIVCSVQVIAQAHGYERWGNLPRERNRLFELISRTNASGVIFLSGDRHIGALYKLDVGGPFPLYEVTSSSLNRPSSLKSEAGVYRLGEFYGRENFGMVAIDWVTESVSLELRDIEGEVVRQVVISLSEIGLPPLTGSKWKRIGKAVEELLAKERPEGEKVH